MQDLTGKDIGRYHVLKKLGQGGMAVVYQGFDTRLERDVALKFIRIEAFSPEVLERVLKRFEKEGKALGRFSHGNIMQVYDYGEYEGAPYLVMEYLPGGTLKDFTGRPIDWHEAFRLIIPIARGLVYAHGKGVIHRDIKPSNILITETGEPKLADFGIARILEGDEGSTLTGTGVGVGTPEYMAPEQAQGKTPDGRADVYALGVVLYELITGRKPFTADTPMAVVIKQAMDPLPHPGEFVKDLPKEVEQVLFKALAKDPENRYEDMEKFVASMEKLLWKPLESGQSRRVEEEKPPQSQLKPEIARLPADPEATRDDLLVNEIKAVRVKTTKRHFRVQSLPWWVWAGGVGGMVVLVVLVSFFSSGGNVGGLAFLASETAVLTHTSVPVLTQTPSRSATPTITPEIGSTLISKVDGMVQVYVPEGEFQMGSIDGENDEKPAHTVYLDAFWIDQTEVTNAMYALCVSDGACGKPVDRYYGNPDYWDHPVVYVNWYEAAAYCEWAGRELPTEAQWEKAARGVDARIYPWGNVGPNCGLAQFWECEGELIKAGRLAAGVSPYKVLDMAGNVREWVADWYDNDYYLISPDDNPTGPINGQYRVVRGGSWGDIENDLRSANRFDEIPGFTSEFLGFRCLISTAETP